MSRRPISNALRALHYDLARAAVAGSDAFADVLRMFPEHAERVLDLIFFSAPRGQDLIQTRSKAIREFREELRSVAQEALFQDVFITPLRGSVDTIAHHYASSVSQPGYIRDADRQCLQSALLVFLFNWNTAAPYRTF